MYASKSMHCGFQAMKHKSYLLAIDGSLESKAAANLAWSLAKQTGARVVAQHVVNTRDTWRFLRPKSPGLIGSSPYIEAFENVTKGLRSIAEALMTSYRAQAEGQNINFETYIDEGDLVTEICHRAKDHDLLILGHGKNTNLGAEHNNVYSVCEELSEFSPIPLLFVMAESNPWQKMHVTIASTRTDPSIIESLSEFGQELGLSAQLHISSSISGTQAKNWLDVLSMQKNAKYWNIYMDSNGHKPANEDELAVLVPAINQEGRLDRKQVRSCISTLSPAAVLLWNQPPQAINKRTIV